MCPIRSLLREKYVYLHSNAAEREECVYLHSNAAEREKILMKILLLRERNSNGFGSAPANSNGFGIAPACRLDAKVRIRMDSAALQRAFARVVV